MFPTGFLQCTADTVWRASWRLLLLPQALGDSEIERHEADLQPIGVEAAGFRLERRQVLDGLPESGRERRPGPLGWLRQDVQLFALAGLLHGGQLIDGQEPGAVEGLRCLIQQLQLPASRKRRGGRQGVAGADVELIAGDRDRRSTTRRRRFQRLSW